MCFLLAFIWFGAQGSRGGFAAFFYWGDARKWHLSHQSLVTPTIGTIGVIYDTSRPLEKGRAEGAGWIHVAV